MLIATVAGNLGSDAELREAGDYSVLNFSIASDYKDKNEKKTQWVRCAIWGKRGEALEKYLTKGTKVTAVGELRIEMYDGKPQVNLRVDQIQLMGGGTRDRKESDSREDDRSAADPF